MVYWLDKSFYNYFVGLNQTQSNDFNEYEIIERGKISQIKKSSSVFYGGIVFPKEFDYDDGGNMTCTSVRCRNMNYTIRFTKDYTESQTNQVYNHDERSSQYGM